MATLDGVIASVAEKLPHTYERQTVISWINALEGRIQLNVFGGCLDETVTYTEETDGATELIVRPPHDDIYELWLRAQIHAANGEWDEYANALGMYNDAYSDYVRWFADYYGTHKRRCGDPPHYLSAYGVAVRNGFVGTPKEWLDSLVGPQGEAGPAGPIGQRGEDGPVGPIGPQGKAGPAGPQGVSGVFVGSGEMPAGYNVQIDPNGEAAMRITIGTVETLPPGSEATATITGTPDAPVLHLGLPRGEQGVPGPQGGPGPQGDTGPAPKLAIGKVLTSRNGYANAYFTTDGDGTKRLNLVIPQGPQGEAGSGGEKAWVQFVDVELTEAVAYCDFTPNDAYTEICIECAYKIETAETAAKSILFGVGRAGNYITRNTVSVKNGDTVYQRAWGKISPSKRAIFDVVTSNARFANMASNCGDPTATDYEYFDGTFTIRLHTNSAAHLLGVGSTIKIWGR